MAIVRRITPLLSVLALVAAAVSTPVSAMTGPTPIVASVSLSSSIEDLDPQVLVISVDALNPDALRRLGHRRTPNLWRLIDEGAATLNARTQTELTLTLPNHTSMVTGRRIDAARGGHGVDWNDDLPGRPAAVQTAAGHSVESVFSVAHAAQMRTALFAAKTKFSLFQQSWPESLDRVTIKEERDAALVRALNRDLVEQDRDVTFVHLGQADRAGHDHSFMGAAYLRAVQRIDSLLGTVLKTADRRAELDDLTIILTSDHGGLPGTSSHSAIRKLADYRIPFLVWGPDISPADLYDLNPGYVNPRRTRPDLRGKQPVRNGDAANVALALVGLDPIPGSRFGRDRPLRLSED